MLKMTITPSDSTYLLPIPVDYVGKTLELLLYSTSKPIDNKLYDNKRPSDFFGTLSTEEGNKFQDYVTNSRLEWDRNI
ncbi:MAG: hypothetical protein FWF09_05240 [Bacteroidales bacterium]|nr:hypothetical protein [Bacteroidales bacterium]